MSGHLVSVIVPIYNTEEWLDSCIRSIISQSYSNLDLILVDDGSTDRCPQICDAWEKRDRRIRVIHKENEGLGKARNSGLERVRGDYFCFVDSDDCLLPTAIEQALNCAVKTGAELVSFGCETISETGKVLRHFVSDEPMIYPKQSVLTEFLPRLLRGEGCCFSAWSLLYSAELLHRSRWRFVSEREIISEDYYSLLELMSDVNCAALLPQVLYQYRQRSFSLSRQYHLTRFDRCCHCHQEMVALCRRKNYPAPVLETVGIPFLNNSIGIMKQLISEQRRREELHRIIQDDLLQNVLSGIEFRSMSRSKRLFCSALRCRCDGLCLLLLKLQCWRGERYASADS